MADLKMCEKYGFDYIEIRYDCIKEYLKEHTLSELDSSMTRERGMWILTGFLKH